MKLPLKIYLIFNLYASLSCAWANTHKHILILGDSLTEGIGMDEAQTYPRILEKKLKERKHNVSITNGGISGSTTATGLSRLKWHLKKEVDILALQLGANDGLRGLDLNMSKKNLLEIIKYAQEKKVKVYNLLKDGSYFKSLIVITHDLNLAFRLGYKILYLHPGEIHFYGSSETFFDPSNLEKLFGSYIKSVEGYFMVNYDEAH